MEGHTQIVQAIDGLRNDIAQRHSENVTSLEVTERKVDEVIRRVDELHKAFPGGDPDGHRRYHETLIERAEARTKFYNDLRAELAKKGLWALLALIGIAVWQYFKSKVIA
ncbi:hypothetical protein [Paraburkholderia bannensis]|uniref:hypothetical protein n=1 Tax=Paraburkholderia bannensis TaxID=765414 RepID=UPI002ABD32A5|nr:hypothetical protein [Paraburkholderia bannensis]